MSRPNRREVSLLKPPEQKSTEPSWRTRARHDWQRWGQEERKSIMAEIEVIMAEGKMHKKAAEYLVFTEKATHEV